MIGNPAVASHRRIQILCLNKNDVLVHLAPLPRWSWCLSEKKPIISTWATDTYPPCYHSGSRPMNEPDNNAISIKKNVIKKIVLFINVYCLVKFENIHARHELSANTKYLDLDRKCQMIKQSDERREKIRIYFI